MLGILGEFYSPGNPGRFTPVAIPDLADYRPPAPPSPSTEQLERLADMLDAASRPVFLMGRVSRSETDWAMRVALAEHVGAKVLTDIKTGASFPTDHPAHVGPPSFFIADEQAMALREADLIVAFDWVDPAGALCSAGAEGALVNITLDHQLANGWSLDHMAQPAAKLHIAALPDTVIGALGDRYGLTPKPMTDTAGPSRAAQVPADGPMTMDLFAAALTEGLSGAPATFVRLPLGWNGGGVEFRHPLDYLGYDGGAGIGSGPGMLVGAALALEGSGRIPVGVLGDGDTMMGLTALWTAARYQIPMIAVVCNNRSFYNDEIHQEKVARMRGRPVENKSVGQAIAEPDIDFASLARAQGLEAIGPVETADDLAEAVKRAVGLYRDGAAVLIDARVAPEYAGAMAKGMTETGG